MESEHKPINGYCIVCVNSVGHSHIEKDGMILANWWGQWASTPRMGTLVAKSETVPKIDGSCEWEMEDVLEVGDFVWMRFLGAWSFENEPWREVAPGHYLISMNEITAAKRGDQIVCVNGYMLVEPVYDIESVGFMGNSGAVLCKVNHIGKPNKRHMIRDFVDHGEVEVGDVIVYRRFGAIKLEEEARQYFGDNVHRLEGYKALAKYDIMNKKFTPIGPRLIVQMLRQEGSYTGIEIPDSMKTQGAEGMVLEMGARCKELLEREGLNIDSLVGCRVLIRGNGGQTVGYNQDEGGLEIKIVDYSEIASIVKIVDVEAKRSKALTIDEVARLVTQKNGAIQGIINDGHCWIDGELTSTGRVSFIDIHKNKRVMQRGDLLIIEEDGSVNIIKPEEKS